MPKLTLRCNFEVLYCCGAECKYKQQQQLPQVCFVSCNPAQLKYSHSTCLFQLLESRVLLDATQVEIVIWCGTAAQMHPADRIANLQNHLCKSA